MAISSVSVRGFRNLAEATVEFDPEANFLFGPNGAGKTNLLEAVHYLAIGRSFRGARDRDLVGFEAEALVVSGADGAGHAAEIRADRQEKRALLGGRPVARLSDFLGWLPVVVLLLDDVQLVQGAPGLRRGFLDLAIAKAERGYIPLLAAFRRALAQRNRALVQGAGAEVQQTWEEELVRAALPVAETRARLVPQVLAAAGEYCQRLEGAPVEFEFRPDIAAGPGAAERYARRLAETRKRSAELGRTLNGPQRDDIAVTYGGRELRRFGSVGEQRLAAVALRLAEAELLVESGSGRPVFLLDEVASELDERRARNLFELVRARGQLVYAAARPFDAAGRVFDVRQGTALPVCQAG